MICPKCGRENEDGKMICVECGCELKTVHIHSHKVKNRLDEFITVIVFSILTAIGISLTVKYFSFSIFYISLALMLLLLFVLFEISEIVKCLIAEKRLNKAYMAGNTMDAEVYGLKYSGYKKGYEKLLPASVISLCCILGTNYIIGRENMKTAESFFVISVIISVIFIIIGLVEMLRKSN